MACYRFEFRCPVCGRGADLESAAKMIVMVCRSCNYTMVIKDFWEKDPIQEAQNDQ